MARGPRLDTQSMRRILAIAALAFLMVAGRSTPASADITGFLCVSPTPGRHNGTGGSIGMGLIIVGVEFEYARLKEDQNAAIPGLATGMANVLVQTPTKIQIYATTGFGFFSEGFRGTSTRGLGSNIGGGVKVPLMGPLKLRLDYRVYQFKGDPLYKNPKRFYGGVSVAF